MDIICRGKNPHYRLIFTIASPCRHLERSAIQISFRPTFIPDGISIHYDDGRCFVSKPRHPALGIPLLQLRISLNFVDFLSRDFSGLLTNDHDSPRPMSSQSFTTPVTDCGGYERSKGLADHCAYEGRTFHTGVRASAAD